MRIEKSIRRLELLSKSTSAEKAACTILGSMRIKYISQFPIKTGRKTYYADIFIPSLRLILEIDGDYHHTREQSRLDKNRSTGIRRLSYHVCRLSNHDAYAISKIKAKLRRYSKEKTSVR